MKAVKFAYAFLAFQALSCFVGWLGGYNFDYRNAEVAWWAGISLVFGAMFSAIYSEI